MRAGQRSLSIFGVEKKSNRDSLTAALANHLSNPFVDRDDLVFTATGGQIYGTNWIPVDGARHLERAPTSTKFPRVGDAKMVRPRPKPGPVLQYKHLIDDQFFHITPRITNTGCTS